jgi:hypothetical protein
LVTLADGRERNRAAIFAQGDIDHGRDGKTTFSAQTHNVFLSAQATNIQVNILSNLQDK